jgi:hypothetical protein
MRNILKKKKSTIISLKIKEALCKAQFISNNKEYRFTGSALRYVLEKLRYTNQTSFQINQIPLAILSWLMVI